jgi:hypothetical protein
MSEQFKSISSVLPAASQSCVCELFLALWDRESRFSSRGGKSQRG